MKSNVFVIICVVITQENDSKSDDISKLFTKLREFNNIFSNN